MRQKPTVPRIVKDAMDQRGVKDTYQYVRKCITPLGWGHLAATLEVKGVMAARAEAYDLILRLYPR